MIIKQFLCTSLLLLAQTCVSSGNNEHVETLVRGRYNFNHPPTVEDYNPIPVSVIYDEEVVTGRKLINESDHESKSTKDVNVLAGSFISDDVVKHPSNDAENKDFKSKGRAFSYEQIPVAVVYDMEYEKLTRNDKLNHTLQNRTLHRSHTQIKRQQPLLKGKEIETTLPINDDKSQAKTRKNTTIKTTAEVQAVYEKLHASNHEIHSKPKKRSPEREPVVPIIESENYVYSHTGDYHYSYESGDGTKAFQEGELKKYSDGTAGESVVGSIYYKDTEGNDFSLSYTADENGYRPVGDHLPTPPPIPPAIARALHYLSTKTTPQAVTETSRRPFKHT